MMETTEPIDDLCKILRIRFGDPRGESKRWEYWTIEHTGFSDPEYPSWFSVDNLKFPEFDIAEKFAVEWAKNRGVTEYRIVKRVIEEEYTYYKSNE